MNIDRMIDHLRSRGIDRVELKIDQGSSSRLHSDQHQRCSWRARFRDGDFIVVLDSDVHLIAMGDTMESALLNLDKMCMENLIV